MIFGRRVVLWGGGDDRGRKTGKGGPTKKGTSKVESRSGKEETAEMRREVGSERAAGKARKRKWSQKKSRKGSENGSGSEIRH
jgi:hypothetical protein